MGWRFCRRQAPEWRLGERITNVDKALDYACGDGVGWADPIVLGATVLATSIYIYTTYCKYLATS